MKHKVFLFAVLMMALALPQSVKAYEYDFSAIVPSGQTLYFKFSTGGKVTVTYPYYFSAYNNPTSYYHDHIKPAGHLVIPATISVNGVIWDIVSIDDFAFYGCSDLTSVTIECPGNISQSAFNGCSGLTCLIVGDSISSIGSAAFYNCSNLNTVIIGKNVTSIGGSGFAGCYSLGNITSFAATPPTASSSAFTGVSANCSIIVPTGSSSAYSMVAGWSQFANIAEMSSSITANVYSSNTIMGVASVSRIANIFTLTATANENYHFVQWNDGNTDNPRTLTLTADASFTAQFAPNQYTITGSSLPGGTVTGGGTGDFLSNVTLTATPNEGYYFSKWRTWTGSTYEDYSTDNPLTVEVTENMTYYASFERIVCNVAAVSSDSTMGYTIGSGTVYYGNNIQLQAYANTGYRFVGWSDGVIASSRSVHVTSDVTLTAIFEPIPQYVLSLGVDNSMMGNVSGGGTFYDGTTVTFSAAANTGYRFVGWSDGVYSATRSITLTGDTVISANFEYIDYAVRAQSGNVLRGTVEGSDTVHYGETVTLTATAYEHYVFQYWQTAGGEIFGQNPLVLTVTSNGVYTAVFAAEQHSVQVLTDGGGTAYISNGSNSGNYDYFTQLTLTATANGNNAFLRWSDGNTFNPRTVTITSDTIFTAMFLNGTTFLHDTIIDTVYFNHYTHDTTYINNYVHDTIYLYQTVYEYTHDTLVQYVNQYVHDTTFVNSYVHDTVLMTTHVFDTTIVNIYHYDTAIYNNYQFDTTIINNHYYDTVFVHLHDTIYITEEGVGGVEGVNAKVYSSRGQIVVEGAEGNTVWLYDAVGRLLATRQDDYSALRFDVPATGTYLIKVGNHPARRVVVVR